MMAPQINCTASDHGKGDPRWRGCPARTSRAQASILVRPRPSGMPTRFDRLVLDHVQFQAVMREHSYAERRTALVSVTGGFAGGRKRSYRWRLSFFDSAICTRPECCYARGQSPRDLHLRAARPRAPRRSRCRRNPRAGSRAPHTSSRSSTSCEPGLVQRRCP